MLSLRSIRSHRLTKFAVVGTACALVQILLLHLLVNALQLTTPFEKTAANTVAFFISVQLNFVWSVLYTWSDRDYRNRKFHQYLAFNTMMIGSLIANQLVFSVAVHILPIGISALVGIIAGAGINLLISHFFIFPKHQIPHKE